MALLHGSELSVGPPFPESESPHSVAVGHAGMAHRVENLARELDLHFLSFNAVDVFGLNCSSRPGGMSTLTVRPSPCA